MRKKTDAKRLAIMEAAVEVFRDQGFERASMATIAARVGGSKTTLYSYFASKDELFADVMLETMDEQAQQVFNMLDGRTDDPRGTLIAFGKAYLEFLLVPDVLATLRTGIGGAHTGTLGRALYERGPKMGWARVAQFFGDCVAAGRFREVYPWIAALQFKGMIEAGLLEPSLFGADVLFPRNVVIDAAVDAFLRAYAIEPDTCIGE